MEISEGNRADTNESRSSHRISSCTALDKTVSDKIEKKDDSFFILNRSNKDRSNSSI
jgi:hypothetical protein